MISYYLKKKRWAMFWQSSTRLWLCWSVFLSFFFCDQIHPYSSGFPSNNITIACAQSDSLQRKCTLEKSHLDFDDYI